MLVAYLIGISFILYGMFMVYESPPCMKCGGRYKHTSNCEWKKYLDQKNK